MASEISIPLFITNESEPMMGGADTAGFSVVVGGFVRHV
jgi:hypothetical protein